MVGLRPFMRRRCCLPSAEQPSSEPSRCKKGLSQKSAPKKEKNNGSRPLKKGRLSA